MTVSDTKRPQKAAFAKNNLIKDLTEADKFVAGLFSNFSSAGSATANNKKGVINKRKPVIKNPNKVHLTEGPKKVRLAGKGIEELQKMLDQIKGNRKSYTDKLLKKNLINRIKKKTRKEERKKKRLEKGIKTKKGQVKSDEADEPEQDEMKQELESKLHLTDTETDERDDSGSDFIYNKLEFSDEEEVLKRKKTANKDPKRALEKIEKTKSRIRELESTGRSEKASTIKFKQSWHNAIQRAEGVKVKDDVELLKKSIKKRDRRKQKSKKDWEGRKEQVETKKAEAQKKRKQNIMNKLKEKKQKKLKRAVKKGRIVL